MAGDGGGAVIGSLVTFAPIARSVQFALQIAPPLRIGGVVDVAFQLLLVAALLDVIGSHVGTRVVPERSEAAAVELKLDQVLLHNECRDRRTVAAAQRRAILLEASRVLLPVHRIVALRPQIHALLRSRHIDLQGHLLADEGVLQRTLAGILSARRRSGKRDQEKKDTAHT